VEHPVERTRHVQELRHVLLDELEVRAPQQVRDVVRRPGGEVVHPDDLVPLREEAVAEVGAEKAGRAGDEDAHGARPDEEPERPPGDPR
jgi:hypothetical protein